MDSRQRIAKRAAAELYPGEVVNLGIGIPLAVPQYLPPDMQVHLHTENGMLEMGPAPDTDCVDPNIVNAAKRPVTECPGTSYFDSAASFAMIRSGHVDVALLGGLQVDQEGKVANWTVPGRGVMGVGGAMDLLAGACRVIVLMTHCSKDGTPKIVPCCTFPLTGKRAADVVVTDLAVFRVGPRGLVLIDLQDGVSLEEIKDKTSATFEVALKSTAS